MTRLGLLLLAVVGVLLASGCAGNTTPTPPAIPDSTITPATAPPPDTRIVWEPSPPNDSCRIQPDGKTIADTLPCVIATGEVSECFSKWLQVGKFICDRSWVNATEKNAYQAVETYSYILECFNNSNYPLRVEWVSGKPSCIGNGSYDVLASYSPENYQIDGKLRFNYSAFYHTRGHF